MIEYINGDVASLTATEVVLDSNGVGYSIQISLNSYSNLTGKTRAKLYIYEAIREDAHTLYGFAQKQERALFLLLISVSGVGANTARVILSSFAPQELEISIATGNVGLLKSVKGIGAKTAERIIVDLKDKVAKGAAAGEMTLPSSSTDQANEAIAALVMLGFAPAMVQKAVSKVLQLDAMASVESIIKQSLKIL